MTDPLTPGAVIGILGGGQLGRMLSVAAARLGFRTHIFEPGADCPAGDLAHRVTTAGYDDIAALTAFAASVDVITYEFENIPTAALDLLEASRPVRPGRRALAVSQDRIAEKDFLTGLGLICAPYAAVGSLSDLEAALARTGVPASAMTAKGRSGFHRPKTPPPHGLQWRGPRRCWRDS
jgi:5-(carboxyamino)imidazole ribonucleotide synthase